MLELALKESELSARELAVWFADQLQYFVSESSVYRLLKAHDLITSPAFILMKAADRFAQPTTTPNQLWPTDFTYLRVIGWGGGLSIDGARRLRALCPGLEAMHHHDLQRCR